jgi:bifunctional ADP-heptose synthase (sugar kinase/adenylyltransferase)
MLSFQNKIISIENLDKVSQELRAQGKQIVLCQVAFDQIHNELIRFLESARENGDVLFVAATEIPHTKNDTERPVTSIGTRMENLAALQTTDYIFINPSSSSAQAIESLKPHVFIKEKYPEIESNANDDFTKEQHAISKCQGKIILANKISSISAPSQMHFGLFPETTQKYLSSFRKKYQYGDIIQKIKDLSRLNVLVIGDAIIDEYHYSNPLGPSGKGSHLSVQYVKSEQFAGGSLAVANHLAAFSNSVTLVTGLGKKDNRETFIRSKLKSNINPLFHYFEDAPTVVKRRYVDFDLIKLFEVYFYNDEPSQENLNQSICPWLMKNVEDFDIVFVPDFGNGFISQAIIKELCEHARFLAVNTQVNSGNRGYHAISRYPRADFICVNEVELRMTTHNRHDPVDELAKKVANKLKARFLGVTQGTQGAFILDHNHDHSFRAPVLSTKVLDRIGAGDTFLSIAGLCLGGGLSPEIATFAGSASAALDVQIVCNRETIEPHNLYSYITTLLK